MVRIIFGMRNPQVETNQSRFWNDQNCVFSNDAASVWQMCLLSFSDKRCQYEVLYIVSLNKTQSTCKKKRNAWLIIYIKTLLANLKVTKYKWRVYLWIDIIKRWLIWIWATIEFKIHTFRSLIDLYNFSYLLSRFVYDLLFVTNHGTPTCVWSYVANVVTNLTLKWNQRIGSFISSF